MTDYNTKNRRLWFKDLMKKHARIAVCGSPKSGKTTLTRLAHGHRTVFHSDDFKIYLNGIRPGGEDDGFDSEHLDRSKEAWSAVSQKMVDEVNATPGKVIVEGVRAPHALRKGMKVDAVLWLGCMCPTDKCTCGNVDLVDLKPGHKRMRKAGLTVLAEWRKNNPKIPVYWAPKPTPFQGDEPGDFDDDT